MRRNLRRVAAGTAGALLAATGAGQAAETAPSPDVPRLGICGAGSGGFRLPGTDGCLTIGGFVRAERGWTLASPRLALAPSAAIVGRERIPVRDGLSRTAFGTSARLTADMRLPTELGPVRVFLSLRGRNGIATDRAAR